MRYYYIVKKYKKIIFLFIFIIFVLELCGIGKFKPQGKPIHEKEMFSKIARSDIGKSVNYTVYKAIFQQDNPFAIYDVYKIELTTRSGEKFKSNILWRKSERDNKDMSFQLIHRDEIHYKIELNILSWFLSLICFILDSAAVVSSLIFAIYIFMAIKRESTKINRNTKVFSKEKLLFNFKDVAGNEEEKEEMKELIDFLKQPQKYSDMGAIIPKGVLLEGPPGTGKTLLAKALAGESSVPFYAVSGSDFVEKYVGVGASRIRDLFKEMRNNKACILFIDEIDVLGGKRGYNLDSGNIEREQTLNQLLTEMDGFNKSQGIIVIGATNRIDMIDSALLRPGRFDRIFKVGLPDVKAREDILRVHALNKKIAPEVDFKQLAKQTPGMSGAQLASVLNEASILTVRNKKTHITTLELEEAVDRVLMGPAKKSIKYVEEEKKMVAYHEAGHAVIGLKLKHAQKVQKITIIPRGSAGGYNLMMPEKETFFSSKKRMLASIISYLGGRVAEEIMFDDISSGAYNDFQQAALIAQLMVTKYGMSDLGPIQNSEFSDKKAIDNEIKKIINFCHQEARKIIQNNKTLLDKIANLLLEQETITSKEIEQLLQLNDIKKLKK